MHHTVQSNHIILFCHRIFRAGGAGTAGTAGAVPLFTLYANLNSACSARKSGHGIKTRAARCRPINVWTACLYSWRKFLTFQISPITLGVYCFPTDHLERLLSLASWSWTAMWALPKLQKLQNFPRFAWSQPNCFLQAWICNVTGWVEMILQLL